MPILFLAAWSCSAFSAGEENQKNSLSPWNMCETAIEKLEIKTTVPPYLLKHLSSAKSGFTINNKESSALNILSFIEHSVLNA